MPPLWVMIATLSGFVCGFALTDDDDDELKFADCPVAVRKTFQAESKGTKIDTVTKEKNDDDQMVYWADVAISGKTYSVGVLEDGTLSEMSLSVDDEELELDGCPGPVQDTFRGEAYGEKIESIGRDRKYGVMIYQTIVAHKGKSYTIIVAEDGTLVEKVLVINEEDIKISDCPAAVRTALHDHAQGGEIGNITRSTGIGQNTFEAEIKLKARVYLVEVAENGALISKSLEAVKD
jgi:hypothetical protein